jgi:hypothetical protein
MVRLCPLEGTQLWLDPERGLPDEKMDILPPQEDCPLGPLSRSQSNIRTHLLAQTAILSLTESHTQSHASIRPLTLCLHNSTPHIQTVSIPVTNHHPTVLPHTPDTSAIMCNNRFSGVCRSICCRPVASASGSSSAFSLAATITAPQAPMPVAGPVAQAPLPVAVAAALAAEPRLCLPIPAFNAGPTIGALKASFKKLAKDNAAAIKAGRIARRQRAKQLRKLRSYKRETVSLPQLPRVARSDAEGLTAALALTPALAPRQVFSHEGVMNKCRQYGNNPRAHELVKANIWAHSTMMSTIDLRDDETRSFNGNALRSGAIFEPEHGLEATDVILLLWVEMAGNKKRALREFTRVARCCPKLRSLHVHVVGENSRPLARHVKGVLKRHFNSGFSEYSRLANGVAVTWETSAS